MVYIRQKMDSWTIFIIVICSVLGVYLILFLYEFLSGVVNGHFNFIKTIEYLQGYQDALDGLPRRRGTGYYEKAQDLLRVKKGRLEKLLKDREKHWMELASHS